ncbi:MAG: glycine--tRNA ligase [Patescibacteria group bacterium]
MQKDEKLLDKIVSLAKRRGFVFQGSEIYGGFAGMWDYGPYGVALKNNIKNLWWKMFVDARDDVWGIDAAILMPARVWDASGHTGAGFTDPLVECAECKKRFRADHLEDKKKCPECGGMLGEERQFNLMFETRVGALEDSSAVSYLRPETAQGIFVNFKNVVDSVHPKLPFGIAQVGKAFRNEITPRDFIFRIRELEQMEIEYFVKPTDWERVFEEWREATGKWIDALGIDRAHVREVEIGDGDRAHYSKRTIDFEYEYPFGTKELSGLAYRTDYDLSNHTKHSGQDLGYFDEETKERLVPHVIEPSFGVERALLAVLCDAYREEEVNGETRVYLKLPTRLAPVKVMVSPLLKNKPELVAKAREVREAVRKVIPETAWDDNGNVGKRYRRQDEIGTPYCVTVDFDSLEKGDVTVRDRDTMEQVRVPISDLPTYLKEKIEAK